MLFVHVLAQAAAAATPEAVAAAPQQGVISYPPSFFAAQQPQNAHEMLLRVPGFSLDVGDTIRGFEGGGGNVLVDGQRPTSKTDNLEEILRRIPVSRIERIDLIRGGAPGIDMQGRSVIANVVRKGGGGFRGLYAFANNHVYDGRDLHGQRLELSGGSGKRAWEASARYGFGADDGAGDGPGVHYRPNGSIIRRSDIESEGDASNYTLTGAYEQPLLGGKVRINGRHFGDKFKFEQDEQIVSPTPGLETSDDLIRVFENEVGGRFDRSLNSRTTMELIGLHQTRDREFTSRFDDGTDEQVFGVERETSESIGRAVLKYRFDDRLQLEAGGEAALNELDSLTSFTFNGAPVDLPAGNVQVKEKRSEAFAKSVWRPTAKWAFEGGLRYERSRITADGDVDVGKTLQFLKPRFTAAWSPSEATQVRVRVERVVGQLRFDDFVASSNFNGGTGVTAGNPDLDPEQAWVGEIALEQRFLGDGVLVLTARRSELKDVIDRGPVFTEDGVFDTPTNIGDGRKDELSAELTLPLTQIGLKGGQLKGEVTRRWSEVKDPTTGADREISALRPIEWSATYSHDLPRLKITYGVDAYGAWRETYYRYNIIETVKLKTFVRPFLEWRMQPDLILRLELANATSRGLRRTVQVFDGPRTATSQPVRIEDQDYQFGRMYYFRIRKTFGA